jgi:hypothetical protein
VLPGRRRPIVRWLREGAALGVGSRLLGIVSRRLAGAGAKIATVVRSGLSGETFDDRQLAAVAITGGKAAVSSHLSRSCMCAVGAGAVLVPSSRRLRSRGGVIATVVRSGLFARP